MNAREISILLNEGKVNERPHTMQPNKQMVESARRSTPAQREFKQQRQRRQALRKSIKKLGWSFYIQPTDIQFVLHCQIYTKLNR